MSMGVKQEVLTYMAHGMGSITKIPAWYAQGKPKPPGKRVTFCIWRHYNEDEPLLESGLIGPVRLRTALRRPIDL